MNVIDGLVEFDENGNLPFNFYKCNLSEFEDRFVKNSSKRRKFIMKYYKNHLEEIKKIKGVLNHWIDGSFVTSKYEPKDIDTLTEIDGIEMDISQEDIQKFFYEAPSYIELCCHSFCVFKYLEEDEIAHDLYMDSKIKFLTIIFGKDRDGNPKGCVELDLFNEG